MVKSHVFSKRGAQYLHKALLAQLDGAGCLEEVWAEVEAQLEGEAVRVNALHLFLWAGRKGTVSLDGVAAGIA